MHILLHASSMVLDSFSDLFSMLSNYYEFANVFSNSKANTLLSYCSYNLKIKLEDDKLILPSPLCSLSVFPSNLLCPSFPPSHVYSAPAHSGANAMPYSVLVTFISRMHICSLLLIRNNHNDRLFT